MKINNLKHYRKKQELTQSRLAEMVGINETYYQKVEYGLSKPNIEIAQKIAQILHTSVEELFPLS